MANRAIYAGTFDPFTNGHLDIVNRSLKIFDEIVILLATSSTKKPLLPIEKRLEMLGKLFADENQVSIDCWDGLLVDYAKNKSIHFLVRGLRPTGDFEIEFQMATMNKNLHKDIETIFLTTGKSNYFISSTLVREIYSLGGDVSPFLPKCISDELPS